MALAHLLAGFGSVLVVIAEWLLTFSQDAQERFDPYFWEGLPVNPVQ